MIRWWVHPIARAHNYLLGGLTRPHAERVLINKKNEKSRKINFGNVKK